VMDMPFSEHEAISANGISKNLTPVSASHC
jgi:hypothetical protein